MMCGPSARVSPDTLSNSSFQFSINTAIPCPPRFARPAESPSSSIASPWTTPSNSPLTTQRLFIFLKNLISSKLFVVGNETRAARPDGAPDENRYDLATRVLWLEDGFHSLAFGFPQHGISALRWGGHQYVHAQGNPHESQRLRPGVYGSKPVRRHSILSCGSIHCSLGHSQNFRHWLCTDSCWGPVAFSYYLQALALLGGIRGARSHGN